METSLITIMLVVGLLIGIFSLLITSSKVRSTVVSKLSLLRRPNATEPPMVAQNVSKRKCPHCASLIDEKTIQCGTCQQKIMPVTLANEERDAALASTDPARRISMVQKLAKFKALSDSDVDALLSLSRDGDSADLQAEAQDVLMSYFKITIDNTHYRYQTYRYDRFDYAVAYAKQDMKKQEQKNDLSIEPSTSR